MARPRTGSIYSTKSGWSARITITEQTNVGPVEIQKSVPLGTHSRSAARQALRKLVAQVANGLPIEQIPEEARRVETVDEAFTRVVEAQGKDGLKFWKDRLSRLKRYASPEIGKLEITKVDSGDIRDVLHSELVKTALSKQSVLHLRNDLSAVFGHLKETALIPVNPVNEVSVPKKLRHDNRPRLLLSDDEFDRFVSSAVVPGVLQLKAASSRNFGGMRTSDLHAWDWEHFDLDTWILAKVYRPKTEGRVGDVKSITELVELVIPDQLKSMLFAYWTMQGRPTSGPVFPVLKGKKKGQRQGKRSHARDLRHYLWLAGVHRPAPGFDEAMAALRAVEAELAKARADSVKGGKVRALQRARLAAQRAAQNLDVLQVGDERYQRPEMHSFRRAFNTALAASGLNIQQAMALSGVTDTRTHMKYVKLVQKMALEMPASAVAGVSASPMLKPAG